MRGRINHRHMLNGVSLADPASTYIREPPFFADFPVVPPPVADYLLNRKRRDLLEIETRRQITIEIERGNRDRARARLARPGAAGRRGRGFCSFAGLSSGRFSETPPLSISNCCRSLPTSGSSATLGCGRPASMSRPAWSARPA